MRKLMIIAAMICMTAGCVKDIKTEDYPNKFTVTDNGVTYTCEGNPHYIYTLNYVHSTTWRDVSVYVTKDSAASTATIMLLNTGSDHQFWLSVTTMGGAYSGTGIYCISHYGTVQEKFNGGKDYKVDTGVVTLSACDYNNVTGTYTLWLSDSTGTTKMITGTVHCKEPYIF